MDAHPGATLAEARGHGSTPEHPSDDYARHDPRYEEYFDRRDQYEEKVNELKDMAYGDLETFNKDGAEDETGKLPISKLEVMAQYDDPDTMIEEHPELEEDFAHYH